MSCGNTKGFMGAAAHRGWESRKAGALYGGTALALLFGAALLAASPAATRAQSPAPDATTETAPSDTSAAEPTAADGAAPAAPAEKNTQAQDGSGTAAPAPESTESTPAATPPAGPLTVVSWGGVYSQSQREAILRPFTRSSGIQVNSRVYAGDLDQLRAQAAAGELTWDVIDLDPAEAEVGCNEGLLEKLTLVLPAAPDGTDAREDFLPGTLHPCGVGSLAWSMVIAHNLGSESDRDGDPQPDGLEDFFDLSTFPGRRGLRRTPMANLEWALLADGAEPDEIYDLLRSEAGVARAFAKLDTIKDEVVWWEGADEPARLLSDGEVVMTSTYNAPAFNDIAVRQLPLELIWDGQIWDIDVWAVPAGTPHRAAALEFLRYATDSERLARQTHWIPYGPVRRSSLALVRDYVHSEIEMAPYLPTAPENLETALRNDALFWREEGPELVARFNAWLAR